MWFVWFLLKMYLQDVLVRMSATGSIDTTFDVGSGFNNTVTSIVSNYDEKCICY